MKKFSLSFFVFAASAVYVAYQFVGGSSASASIAVTNTVPPTPSTQASAQKPAPAPKPKGQYADGTYVGSVADAYYGLVQVQAVIQSGRIVTVNFLQYPSDRRTSQEINAQAMPLLKSEAIQVQSARVSGVSGASYTSAAFIESLGNALAKAKV